MSDYFDDAERVADKIVQDWCYLESPEERDSPEVQAEASDLRALIANVLRQERARFPCKECGGGSHSLHNTDCSRWGR